MLSRTAGELHAVNPDAIRAEVSLANFMPHGYDALEELDEHCQKLIDSGLLVLNHDQSVLQAMGDIKNPEITMEEFRRLSDSIHGPMARLALHSLGRLNLMQEEVKIAISERAALAAFPHYYGIFGNSKIGFAPQTRDEETLKTVTIGDKLGSFANKHAIVVDPMLATGGSLESLIDKVMELGATGVTTVTTFSTPQGVVRIANHSAVRRMLSLPLEAGLTDRGWVVGGHKPHSMLGDSGDRSFGSVD